MGKPNLAVATQADDSAEDYDADDATAADPVVQAASVLREAVQDGDDESIADAMKSIVKLCMSDGIEESPGRKSKPVLSKAFGGKG